ncbi:MAG: hypothetical protein GYA33_09635 [Thermogutta sp.]|nr:hypothetical protein [Thermogutta sp.]
MVLILHPNAVLFPELILRPTAILLPEIVLLLPSAIPAAILYRAATPH